MPGKVIIMDLATLVSNFHLSPPHELERIKGDIADNQNYLRVVAAKGFVSGFAITWALNYYYFEKPIGQFGLDIGGGIGFFLYLYSIRLYSKYASRQLR